MMKEEEYKRRLKNLIEITSNTTNTFYMKNFKVDEVDTDAIMTYDNFGLTTINKDSIIDKDNFLIVNEVIGAHKQNNKVNYKINKNGFRSDHFILLDKNNVNILTSGCSFAFGLGLPEKYIWSNLIKDSFLNKTKDTRVYNLSFPGTNYFVIIKNIFSFIKKHGKPDFIFIDFPNINRDMYYSHINKKFISQVVSINHVINGNDDMKNFVIDYDEGENYLKSINYINSLEMFCNSNDIKLFWTTWSYRENEIFKKIKFDNFYPADFFWKTSKLPKNKNIKDNTDKDDIEFWDIACDNAHPGINWNYERSKFFINLTL